MRLRSFLLVNAIIPLAIGVFLLCAPGVLLSAVKHAEPSETANVMARTVGVLMLAVGTLNFLARELVDRAALRAVLLANLVLQLGILPIDPLAYASGAFTTLGSFLPNTVLHVVLAVGLALHLRALAPKLSPSDNVDCLRS